MGKPKDPPYKPGQKAPVSGQYGVVCPQGGKTGAVGQNRSRGSRMDPSGKLEYNRGI